MIALSTYHNALSDRLVVCYWPSRSVFTVFSKENTIKFQYVSTEHIFPVLLTDAIFSETHLIRALPKFTLAPLGQNRYDTYFELNFGSGYEIKTVDNDVFTTVYEYKLVPYYNKLISPIESLGVDLLYRYIHKTNPKNALYFHYTDNQISVLAWKNGQFSLANSYAATCDEEVFYYTMLVVEQLELPVDSLYFAFIGSVQQYEAYKNIFDNYLNSLVKCYSEMTDQSLEEFALANFFGHCIL